MPSARFNFEDTMCNAKNHRWNCGCGFGGEGRLRRPVSNMPPVPDLFAVPRIPRHYTQGNARCPVCSASVYFFTLENNGRVYFDEIGAPWPKHPCTDRHDSPEVSSSAEGGSTDRDAQARPWEIGWILLNQISVEAVELGTLRLSARIAEEGLITFVRGDAFGEVESPATFLQESFIQTRPSITGQFELVLLTPDLRPMRVFGFPTAADAAASRKS